MAAFPPPGAYTGGWTYGQYQPSPQVTVPLQSPWTQPGQNQQPQQGQPSGFSSTAWRPPNLPSPATGDGNEGWGTGTTWDTQHRNDNGGGWGSSNNNNNRAAAAWDSGANSANLWDASVNNNDGGGWGNDNNNDNGWGNSANDSGWGNSGNDNGWGNPDNNNGRGNSGNDNGWGNTANDGGWGNSGSNGGWGSGERHNNSVGNADDAGNGADWLDTANGRGRERQRQPSRGRPRERERERRKDRDWGDDVRNRLDDWMNSSARPTRDRWEGDWDEDQGEEDDDGRERVEEEEERDRWNLTPAQREREWGLYEQFDRMHLRGRDFPPQTRKHKSKSKSKSRRRDRERTRTHSLPSHPSPHTPAHLPHSVSMPSPYAAYQLPSSPYTPNPYTPAYTPMNLGYAQYTLPGPRQEDVPFRPKTWRADYTIKPSSSPLRFLRRNADAYSDTIKRSLHPSLQVSGSLNLDLRVWNAAALEVGFGGGGAGVAGVVLNQHATSPPTSHMRLVHPRVPWYIDILPSPSPTSSTSSHSYTDPYAYVKVFDVIVGVYHSLTTGPISQVRPEEYWAGEMGEHVHIPSSSLSRTRTTGIWKKTAREQVSHSWRVRGQLYGVGTEGEGKELARGVRRVDWLAVGAGTGSGTRGGEFRWIGLKKARKGIWEVVTEV
ncbi:hypothetical protein WG66_001271 [Moniliophthora roreri]|nr:hypothetical protein WG66_001271 [Moniliophthora roreri]